MSKTTLQNFGVPLDGGNGRGGILMPLLAWRFRAVPEAVSDSVAHHFAQQVENVSIDYVARRLKVNVRATVVPETFDAVLMVTKSGFAPRVDAMDGGDGAIFSIEFNNSKLTKHNIDFGYAEPGHAVHELEWSFSSTSLFRPAKDN